MRFLNTIVFMIIVAMGSGSAAARNAQFAVDLDGHEWGATETNEVGGSFTLEAWISTTSNRTGTTFTQGVPLIYADVSGPAHDFGMVVLDGKLAFGVGNGLPPGSGGDLTVFSTSDIATGTWQHVAAVRDGATGVIQVFVNGILEGSLATGDTTNLSDPGSILVGGNTLDNQYLVGAIDEVRIWDVARSEAEIRATMCKALTGGEANLRSYYRFDYRRIGVTTDASPPGNTLVNHGFEPDDWVWSGAVLGDEVVTSFPPAASVAINHPDGDGLTVDTLTGSPDGLVLVRVDGPPNQLVPPPGCATIDNARHWAVHVVGGTVVDYRVSLSYAGRSEILDESLLTLAVRGGNQDTSWSDAGAMQSTSNDTLTVTGQTGTGIYSWAETDQFVNAITGAGRTLAFDGLSEYAQAPRMVASSFTLEAWIRTGEFGIGGPTTAFNMGVPVIYADVQNYHHDFGTSVINDRFSFGVGNGTPANLSIQSSTVVTNFEWTHVAAVRDGATGFIRIFVNGIEEASMDTGDTTPLNDPSSINIGGNTIDHRYFSGLMDEVRIWNVARSEAEIRSTMCHRLTAGEPGLVANWHFDDPGSTVLVDDSGAGNHASLRYFEDDDRLWSGAPVGNVSVAAYPPSAGLILSHPDGDALTASGFTGTPVGAHLYRVDGPQNLTVPPSGFGTVDQTRHWGVWPIGDPGTDYDIELSYGGHPGIIGEELLGLGARRDNSGPAWEDTGSIPDTLNDRLSLSSVQGQRQFVLLTNGEVPVVLQSLKVD